MATVRYDTLGVFVGPDNVSGNLASGDIKQLSRVQSTNYSIEIQRENTLGLGTAIGNDNVRDAPFVNLNLEYLVTNGQNEKNIGFTVDGIHGSLLNMNSGERDYFLLINKPEEPMVLSIGNGMLTRYSVNAQLNSFLKATVDIKGFNIKVDDGTSGNLIPSVNGVGLASPYTYELPPLSTSVVDRAAGAIDNNIYVGQGQLDIQFPNNAAFATVLSGQDKSYMQGFNFSIGMDRVELTKLGQKYPFKRGLQLPLTLTVSANLLLNNFVADNIANYLCQNDYDLEVGIRSHKCVNQDVFWEDSDVTKLKYIFRGLKLKNFSSSDSIGERKAVNLEWSVPIGNILDINRNLFISGDFGSYAFPIDSFRYVTGETGNSGQYLQAFEKEVIYHRVKRDISLHEFSLELKGDFDYTTGESNGLYYFQGNTGVLGASGKFNTDIVKEDYAWNSDSYSTVYNGLPLSGYSQKFSTIYPAYPIGIPDQFDLTSGTYPFYFKNEGFQTEPIQVSFANLPTYIEASIEYPTFTIDPYTPFFLNTFSLSVLPWDVPTGQAFDFQMVARNSKFKKVYTVHGLTPYSFNITLPSYYRPKTSLWLQPYKETSFTYDSNYFISQGRSDSLKTGIFNAVSGSGLNPIYSYKQKNDKSYITFDSGNLLRNTGVVVEDLRNFTFFSVSRPSGSPTGASILRMYNTNDGLNSAAEAYFGKNGDNMSFHYVNPTGVSGLSGTSTTVFDIPDGFASSQWNLNTFSFDGNRISGRLNGTGVSTSTITINNSGIFDTVEVGGGDYHGDIAEVILFPYHLLPNEISDVENYLKYKWAV